jgi:hypothetical protein
VRSCYKAYTRCFRRAEGQQPRSPSFSTRPPTFFGCINATQADQPVCRSSSRLCSFEEPQRHPRPTWTSHRDGQAETGRLRESDMSVRSCRRHITSHLRRTVRRSEISERLAFQEVMEGAMIRGPVKSRERLILRDNHAADRQPMPALLLPRQSVVSANQRALELCQVTGLFNGFGSRRTSFTAIRTCLLPLTHRFL